MTIALTDQQFTTSRPRLRVAHAPRGVSSARVRRPSVSPSVVVVRPLAWQETFVSADQERPLRPTPRRRLRLTPRGRLVFGALLVLLALLVFSLGRFTAGAAASGPAQRVTVQSGDTLWSIAEHAAPAADPRIEVERIISANHLASGSALTPGDVLLVP